jgi:hypothetical protein
MATRQISIINTLNIQQRKLFLEYAKDCAMRDAGALGTFRSLLAYRDKAYQRQLDITNEQIAALRANKAGDASKLQNMTVPIVMPQVESAVAYQAGVYLTSYPIFGVVAYPKNQDAAMQFETAIGDQSLRYGWARELIKVIRDGYKYNFGAAVCLWKSTPLKQVVTSTAISSAGMASLKEYTYSGNNIQRVDPYNCFMDMSVAPANMHTEGEFFGWNEIVSRIQLKRLFRVLAADKTTQATEAYSSPFPGGSMGSQSGMDYNTPAINRLMEIGIPGGTGINWGQWAGMVPGRRGMQLDYKSHYQLTHFMCRATSQDFGALGNQEKVFYGIIVNWSVVIYVEEMNVGHDFMPAFVMQPHEDGLGYQTQSMLDNALPFQDMSSALWNATLESKRRQIFDRLVYNPRMIDKKDIDVNSAVARIPLRNAAMAKDGNEIARAIYQIPYRDDASSANLQMAEMISGMADQATGQNKVDRGQFQPGNKTRTEFSQTMGNSNSRQQLSSLSIQGQFMTPLKETIKSNTLQFQPAGTILNRDAKQEVEIDPVELRKSMLEFKMTDGMLPMDKIMNPELLMVFLQTAQALPATATEYDIMGMFIYWAKLQGATWLEDFKRDPQQQQQFLQTVQQTAAATEPPQPPQPGAM